MSKRPDTSTASRKRSLNPIANGNTTVHARKDSKDSKRLCMDKDGEFKVPLPPTKCNQKPSISSTQCGKPTTKLANGLISKSSTISTPVTKRITIKNFRQRSSAFETNASAQWKVLSDSVKMIQQKQKTSVTLEELYKIVEELCHRNHAKKMYEEVNALVKKFIATEFKKMVEANRDVGHLQFLQSLNKLWVHCEQMLMIRSVFLYLDRTYVLRNSTIPSLWDAGLDAFRATVMEAERMRNRSIHAIINVIESERSGAHVDRPLLKSLLRMFCNLRIYEKSFEPTFLSATEKTYRNESRTNCQELDIGAYLRHVARRIKEEEERIDYYLAYSTKSRLIACTEKCFIADYVDFIVSRGADVLLNDNRKEELTLLYDLLSRVKNGQNVLRNAFSAYIKKVGKMMVMDAEREKTLVQDLINLKATLNEIVSTCFLNNDKFAQTQKDAFDYFINTRPNKPAELIAKFMDLKLRSGNKECSDEELDQTMDNVILLFRYIQGKDVFEAFYKKDLAKRLLLGRSASVDAEKAMLSKLKNECGAGFTQKLEGMFKDMELSKELCATFKKHLDESDKSEFLQKTEFNVSILTMGHWPNYSIAEVNIPPQLAQFQEVYVKFYTSKHSGRKLQWQYSLASAILKARFKRGVQKELDVSLFQAMVLLMFNDKKEWTLPEILVSTKIDEHELKRTLQSLACGKVRVICKEPKSKEISPTDKFIFNEDFNDRLYRIRISQVQMRETEAEHRQTEEQVFQDRQYQIDAAVVRIMKTRKTLSHNLLISELFNQLRFPVKPVDLKKRIESLIERDYMQRDKEDPQVYNYVA